ncbi:FkbM family methyltransferase [Desulfosarcina sp.]|nr:FkbM family methyltransferase [Desulfosarcina sp.]
MHPVIKTVFGDNTPLDWPRYCVKAVVWQLRKRLGHVFIARLDNGATIKVYPSTAYSGIFYTRHPEGNDLAFISKHADLADTFVDVGANVGLFAASLFGMFQKFVCFEPSPTSFGALAENCALNPDVECELHHVGVGDEKGDLFFLEESEFSTCGRFVEQDGEYTTKIPVDTLDHILSNRYDSLIMKIDVEGFEEKVFLGGDQLFTSQRVKLVMFERLGRTNLTNVRSFLEGRGYILFRILDDMKPTRDEKAILEPLINLFACPSEYYSRLCG